MFVLKKKKKKKKQALTWLLKAQKNPKNSFDHSCSVIAVFWSGSWPICRFFQEVGSLDVKNWERYSSECQVLLDTSGVFKKQHVSSGKETLITARQCSLTWKRARITEVVLTPQRFLTPQYVRWWYSIRSALDEPVCPVRFKLNYSLLSC